MYDLRNGYTYKDSKRTNDLDLDRIRTFIKTEINTSNDSNVIWFNVDYGTNAKEGKFYALRSHFGNKQKLIKKAYSVDDLVVYFFGPTAKPDQYNMNYNAAIYNQRLMIWNTYYNRNAWLLHVQGGKDNA